MNMLAIFAIAVGLSMDAFAVAVVSGAKGVSRMADALRIGGSFGLFQMIMPLLGWALGIRLKHFITAFDHWLVFGLLALIGFKMIHESFSADACGKDVEKMSARRLLVLSVATSVDALAVGISFAFLDYPIIWASAIIGVVTFLIATAGVLIGRFCCCVWGKRAEFVGGVILILMGLKILLEHLR